MQTCTHTISAFYIVFDISRPDSASICTCLHVCVWLWLCLNVCLCGSHFSDRLVFVFFGSFVGHIGHTAIYTIASHCIIHFVVVANGSTVFKFVLCFRLHFNLICWSHTSTHTYVYSHCDRIPQLCWSLWLWDTCIGINCAAGCATHSSCVYDAHTHTHLIEEFTF